MPTSSTILLEGTRNVSPKHRHSFQRYPAHPPRAKIAIALFLRDAQVVSMKWNRRMGEMSDLVFTFGFRRQSNV